MPENSTRQSPNKPATSNGDWAFNFRCGAFDDSDDSDDENGSLSRTNDNSSTGSRTVPTESELIKDLDLSKRDEPGVVYKPNPFSIAKINAATRAKGGDVGASNASSPGFKPQRNVEETKRSAQPGVPKQSMRKGSGKGTMKKKLSLKAGIRRKGSRPHSRSSCNVTTASAASSAYRTHAPPTPSKPLSSNSAHIPHDFASKEPKTQSGTVPSPTELRSGPSRTESIFRSLDNFITRREKAPCPPSVPHSHSHPSPSHNKVITSAIDSPYRTHTPFTPSGTTIPPNTTHIPDKLPTNESISPAVNYPDTSTPTASHTTEENTFRPLNKTARGSKSVIFSTSSYAPPGIGHKAFARPAPATYASELHSSRTNSSPSPPVLVPPATMFPARSAPPEHLPYHLPFSSPQVPVPPSQRFIPRHAHFSPLPNQRKTPMNKAPPQSFSSPIRSPTGSSGLLHSLKGPMSSPLGLPPAHRAVEQATATAGLSNGDKFRRGFTSIERKRHVQADVVTCPKQNPSSTFASGVAPVSGAVDELDGTFDVVERCGRTWMAGPHTSNGYGITSDFQVKDEDLAELHLAVDSSSSFRPMKPRLSSLFTAPASTKYSPKPDPYIQPEYIPARNRASPKLEIDEVYPADQPLPSPPRLESFAREPQAPVSNRNACVGRPVPRPQAPISSKNAKVSYTVPVRPPIDTSVAGAGSDAVKRKRDAYSFSVDDPDEEWSTLPPKKGRKSTSKATFRTGVKTTKPFRIPGLLGDGQRTGMSATSDRRVITFLPPPLARADAATSKERPLTPPRSSPSRTVSNVLPKVHAKIPLVTPQRHSPRALSSKLRTVTPPSEPTSGVESHGHLTYSARCPPLGDSGSKSELQLSAGSPSVQHSPHFKLTCYPSPEYSAVSSAHESLRCGKEDAGSPARNAGSSLADHTDATVTNVDPVTTATDNAGQDITDAIDRLLISQTSEQRISASPCSSAVPTTDDCYSDKEDLQQTIDFEAIKDRYPLRRDLILKVCYFTISCLWCTPWKWWRLFS
ncbi:hypothetical protein BDQ17DRAFT_1362998 [Cyathus striatus]|nr:hypothetical protein BDQ17DRAFT_1362998 [Cyathus striatus]